MPGGYARKRMHDGHTRLRRRLRLRRKTKDLDQIDHDLKNKSDHLLNQDVDLDQPGFAQNYCLHCAKYFINERALSDHFKTKVHKRRLKALQDEPYTEKEADLAAGKGSYIGTPAKRKMETQPSKEEYSEGKRVKVVNYTPEELENMKKKKRKSMNSSNQLETNKMQE
ncbi:CLUMA_CG004505, isoform A [Clunio marinus]|uniref:Zinc finger protein 593 homolog n=1 Tax=Clunio marinus TaxID=568069 RepID=A0A1J1HRY6_9DIPT|nr:CLUMA_CG004505, isoform A [Clunio marinus]